MFTGIVEEMGAVRTVRPGGLVVSGSKVLEGTKSGDSIAVNGACLTVTELSGDSFSVDTVPETLRRTNLGELREGDPVNLERALAFGERMGGHFVQGHVEGTGQLVAQEPDGEALMLTFSAPAEIMSYIVPKGFIAIDGISLTVVDRTADCFRVTIIPFTRDNTILGRKKPGDTVNLETDILAKYVQSLLPALR